MNKSQANILKAKLEIKPEQQAQVATGCKGARVRHWRGAFLCPEICMAVFDFTCVCFHSLKLS